MIEKDNGYYPNKTILSSDPIMFTWHFRRIWIAHKANSTYLEQYITDMIRSSDEYYDKPALDYHLEIIERIKKLIVGVPLEELGLIQAEFPTKVKALLATQSEIVEKEGLITQTTTIPVGNIDLMGISIVKGYRKDFVEAFIKACETPLFLDPDDEVTLADAARDFNSDVMYFAADEAEGWTAITIMAEDIADVMPSIRDEKSFVDEMLAELFPNAPIVTLNQYDTVGAFGFAVTEQGQKRRGYFNVEGNEYENYGEPLPEEKEHSALDTAMFYITKRLTGFAFTEKNINKYFQAIKLK